MRGSFVALLTLSLGAPVLAQGPAAPPSAATPSAATSPATANTWRVDSAHSAATFSVKHMTVSTVRGALGPISGTVEYDGKNISSIKADVTIDVTRIDTGNESRDKDLRGSGFFEVEKYPTATFKSKIVQPGGAGQLRLVGDLTMHGVTKEVTLDVEGPSAVVTTQNGGLKIGATATTKINRREFGLNYNSLIEAGPVVADEVTVTIDLELNKAAQ